jgi:hypothetical protein
MSDTAKKANKLASAVYLVTSFFADQEPLKWRLRQLASDLVSLSLSLNSYLFEDREYAGLENRKIVVEIISLLSMGKNVGLISEDNHSILASEFSKYLEFIGFPSGMEEREGRAVLSESFFSFPARELKQAPQQPLDEVKDKTVPVDNVPEAAKPRTEYLPQVKVERTNLSDKVQKDIIDKPLRQFGAVSVKKNSRQSVIIGLLKRKKEIMIKDVSPLISGCSEKTIQRELSAMVAAGILKKIGDKRWSRYSLV